MVGGGDRVVEERDLADFALSRLPVGQRKQGPRGV